MVPAARGAVSARAGSLWLVVHPPGQGGYARFLVLRRTEGAGGGATGRALLASGGEADVPAAMRAAERVAARMAAV